MDLDGRTAIITGGASGLGNATARALHDAGATVVLVDLPDSDGDAAADAVGDRAHFATADVTDPDQVQAAIDRAVELGGGLHATVNCAGVGWAQRTSSKDGPHDYGAFRKVVEVNLIGTFNVIRLASTQMAGQDPIDDERGVIVNTASIAAFDGQIGQVAYAASKGGVVSLTLPVARDLAGRQIRCVTIAPGTFDTPMLGGVSEEIREALASNIPHPSRLGTPPEFALLVRQIIENPYVNGEVIRLDGGLRMPPR
ncbi:MAG: SDR family NAD(P)-dependent oxidoreductase [Actinobacteria bacterium]|nr:SDR family NAD(P)-dependent oxidoreductase [Actinomycetota bacterium]